MDNLARRVLRMFAIGKLSVINDELEQQTAQVLIGDGGPDEAREILDRTPRLGDYGFAYCPPDGSEAIVLYIGGRRSAGVIVATGHRASRPKGLKPGEAMFYNGLTNDFMVLSADGKIRSQSGQWLHDGDIKVAGTVTASHLAADDGATGSFTTADGKTVTVTHGIITKIV